MKAIITNTNGNQYTILDSSELFGKLHCPENIIMDITCDSCPVGYYPSTITFTQGISSTLKNFILHNNNVAVIHLGDMSFVIRILHYYEKPKEKTFKEALGVCMTEDKNFWNKETLNYNSSLDMSEKGKFEEE